MTYFTAETFRFFQDLAAHNDKGWFDDNRDRYIQHVRDPFVAFVNDVTPHLQAVSPHYRGDPRLNGGSMFRIYRDTRFSKNKTPYKTWGGARFWHDVGGRKGSPIFYLHVQPGASFMGAGLWRPESAMLRRIRQFLHENPNAWLQVVDDPEFQRRFRLGGESLVRMPRGFDADDPVAEHLRRKDFVVITDLTDDEVLADDLPARYGRLAAQAAPFVDYLCAALDLEF